MRKSHFLIRLENDVLISVFADSYEKGNVYNDDGSIKERLFYFYSDDEIVSIIPDSQRVKYIDEVSR